MVSSSSSDDYSSSNDNDSSSSFKFWFILLLVVFLVAGAIGVTMFFVIRKKEDNQEPTVPCTTDADCTAASSTAIKCDTEKKVCVECLASADCTGNEDAKGNLCNVSLKKCVCGSDATSKTQCKIPGGCKNTGSGSSFECVDCVSDFNCPITKPFCDTAAGYTCKGCNPDSIFFGDECYLGLECDASDSSCKIKACDPDVEDAEANGCAPGNTCSGSFCSGGTHFDYEKNVFSYSNNNSVYFEDENMTHSECAFGCDAEEACKMYVWGKIKQPGATSSYDNSCRYYTATSDADLADWKANKTNNDDTSTKIYWTGTKNNYQAYSVDDNSGKIPYVLNTDGDRVYLNAKPDSILVETLAEENKYWKIIPGDTITSEYCQDVVCKAKFADKLTGGNYLVSDFYKVPGDYSSPDSDSAATASASAYDFFGFTSGGPGSDYFYHGGVVGDPINNGYKCSCYVVDSEAAAEIKVAADTQYDTMVHQSAADEE